MVTPRRLPADAIGQFDQWAAAIFDQSSLGMIRVSSDHKIIGSNRTASEILGLPSLEGRSLSELLADQASIDIMRSEVERRREGISSEYEVNVFHFPDRRPIPVKVCGMPMICASGDVVGSLAIICSLEMERRVESFERAIHHTQSAAGIFQAVCEQIRGFLSFDFSAFSIYSKDGRHSRMALSYDPNRQIESQKRWFPISTALSIWTQSHEIQAINVLDFVRQFPELETDPTVVRFLTAGFVRTLRVPIVRGGRVEATFSCSSRDPEAFNDEQVQTIKALPVAKAFLMALHSLENEELSFRFNLMREMFICRTPEKIAESATKRLFEQYGWESVEIYTIEEASRRIRLLSQSASSPEYRIDEDYSLRIDKGVLGYVCSRNEDVRIDNVTTDPVFAPIYVPMHRTTLSELCMPIRVNGRISGLLNIEDRHENAFSEDEQANLRSLLDEIGDLFGAAWDKALLASAFELTPSLVFIADTAHNVIQHNAAALEGLGYSTQELTGSAITNYFEPEIAERLFQSPPLAGTETGIRRKDGTTMPVLLGSRELAGFGAWVVSARDLTSQKRIAELEGLRHMYREIAAQTKTPLSLASSWLQRLQRKAQESKDESSEILQKTLTQLKKVDITYERLAQFSQDGSGAASKQMLLNAGDLLKRITSNLSQEYLSLEGVDTSDLYIRADPFEIEFAVESTVSYLQRFLPSNRKVRVQLSSSSDRLVIHIDGPFPPEPEGCLIRDMAPEDICQTLREMALGGEIISSFMRRHGGSFRQDRLENGDVIFELDLPLVKTEV